MPAPARRPTSCWRANSSAAGALPPRRRNRPRRRQTRRPAMSQPPKPRGLGRGLSALLGDDDVAATLNPQGGTQAPPPVAAPRPAAPSRTPFTLPIAHLRAGPFQPRTTFDDIDSLVDSIRQFGLLQPILVRPVAGDPGGYGIIAGERRRRAAQQADLPDVPVVGRPFDEPEA